MPELVVVGFKDNIHRASGVVDELRVLDNSWIPDLADAVALHRNIDGAVAMDQSYQPTGRRTAEWGGALGLVIGACLSISHLTGASRSIADGVMTAAGMARVRIAGVDASFWAAVIDIPSSFFEGAGRLVLPGDSAIYAIVESASSAVASAQFQRFGGIVLRQSLDGRQQKKIKRILDDRPNTN